ncbi:MAG TPA: DUF4157 domain-containing protein [Archangium sp.]|nr:DUF4157 domain-containing protein [Archangium sp.]
MSRKALHQQQPSSAAPSQDSLALKPTPAPAGSGPMGGVPFSMGNVPILPQRTALTVGESGSPHEQEADRVADRLSRAAEAGPVTTPTLAPRLTVHRKPVSGQEGGGSSSAVHPATEARIQSLVSTGGQALPASTRALYESHLGQSLNHVRVHTDSVSTEALGAQAFTLGRNIVFGTGQYQPETPRGRHLLAHELTHVVQQRAAGSSANVLQRQLDPNRRPKSLSRQNAPFKLPPNLPKFEPDPDTAEVSALLANKAIASMSEDELKKIRDRPDGEARYSWNGFRWTENGTSIVTIVTREQFHEAYVALDKLEVSKVIKQGQKDLPLSQINEEGLKIIKFNPLGYPRFLPDGTERPPITDVVKKEQFEFADDALDQIGAGKGVEGGIGELEQMFEPQKERDEALQEARRKLDQAQALVQAINRKEERDRLNEQLQKKRLELDELARRGKNKVLDYQREYEREWSRERQASPTETTETPRTTPTNTAGRVAAANQLMQESTEQATKAVAAYKQAVTPRLGVLTDTASSTAFDLKLATNSLLAEIQTQRQSQALTQKLNEQISDFNKQQTEFRQQLRQQSPGATAEETQATKNRNEQLRSELNSKLESMEQTRQERDAVNAQLAQERRTRQNALKSIKETTNTETSYGNLVSIGATTGDKSLVKEEIKDLQIGAVKVEGARKLGTAEASYNATVGLTDEGLKAQAQAVAKAALVDFGYEFKLETPDITLKPSDEIIGAKLFVSVKGMVGIEAKAAIEANARRSPLEQNGAGGLPRLSTRRLLAGTGMNANPSTGLAVGAAGSVEAFAGARLSVGVGGAVEWKKKHPSVYTQKLSAAIAQLFPTVGTLAKGSPELTVQFLDFLFGKGTPGTVTVLGIEATGEGSAGIGGKLAAEASWKGGKLVVRLGANGTFGVGLGGNVQVTLNAVDGAKLMLLWGTDLLKVVTPTIREKGQKWIAAYAPSVQEVAKWWTSDVEALQRIKTKGLATTSLNDRINLVRTLLDGLVTEQEELAVLQILEYSATKKELKQLADAVGHRSILFALDEERNTRARELGVSWW